MSYHFKQEKTFLYVSFTLRNNFRTCSNFEHFFLQKCSKIEHFVFGRLELEVEQRLELEHYFMCSKINHSNVERLPCVLLQNGFYRIRTFP